MTLLDSLRTAHPDLIVLEGGNFGEAASGPSAWKAGEQLKVLKQLNYDAVTLGQNDLTPNLAEVAGQSNAKDMLFSSLAESKTKMKLPPVKIIKRPGFELGVISLISPGFNREANASMSGNEAFLREQLKQLADKKVAFKAVVYLGPEEELSAISKKFLEVDVWLLTQGNHQPIRLIENVGDALVISGGDRGREIGLIKVEKQAGGEREAASFQQIILNDKIADSPKAAPILESYRAAGRAAQTKPANTNPSPSQSGGNGAAFLNPFVGSSACQDCHDEIFGKWQESLHAHAYATLVAKNEQANAECLSCHTVGFGEETGYNQTAATAHLTNVGCESCHGRGGLHVRTRGTALSFAKATEATCVRCHTEKMSPKFAFAEWVTRVH